MAPVVVPDWRCLIHGGLVCPLDGCPDAVLSGGVRVPAGCARGLGWTPDDGDDYPVSLAAAVVALGQADG